MATPIAELLKCLKKDASGILTQGQKELFLARAPGRLDVMGGIAATSGSLVCELPLDVAAAVAVQRREDRKLVIREYSRAGEPGVTVEMALEDFFGTASLLPDATVQGLFKGVGGGGPQIASVAGVYPMLAKHRKMTRRTLGANIALYSTVPGGAGLGSCAALSCATLSALMAAYHFILEPLETAVLAQRVEQHVVGLPVGISGSATSVLGKKDQLLLMECQPHEPRGYLSTPAEYFFAGIVAGEVTPAATAMYHSARSSAFMAQTIIARMYVDMGFKKSPTEGYLANVSSDLYRKYFRAILPEKISGKAFLDIYGPPTDRVTVIEAAGEYAPRAVAQHYVLESARVREFVERMGVLAATKDAATREREAVSVGKLMSESYRSSRENLGLGSKESELLGELLAKCGPAKGIYGSRGTGGTATVLAASTDTARQTLAEVCEVYKQRTGKAAQLLAESSSGCADVAPLRMPLSAL